MNNAAKSSNNLIKDEVLKMCWQYIRDNFHKFNETNKIKISLSLATKNLPQQVEGSLQAAVVMENIKVDGQVKRFNLGDSGDTETVADAGEDNSGAVES